MHIDCQILAPCLRKAALTPLEKDHIAQTDTCAPTTEEPVEATLKLGTHEAMLNCISRRTACKGARLRYLPESARSTPLVAASTQMGSHDGRLENLGQHEVALDEAPKHLLERSPIKEADQAARQEVHRGESVELDQLEANQLSEGWSLLLLPVSGHLLPGHTVWLLIWI